MRAASLVGSVVLAGSVFLSSGDATATGSTSKENLSNGAKIFQTCGSCHTTVPSVHAIGPSLIGKSPGEAVGFQYSDGMEAFGKTGAVWDEATIEKFIKNPRRLVDGTTMPYRSLRNPNDRRDLIAYLKSL